MKILVVISPAHRKDGAESMLLKKSVQLAERMGASLELLHVVHEFTLEGSPFLDEDPMFLAREDLIDDARGWVEQLASDLAGHGVAVRFDVRWDAPRGGAILRKIEADEFDLVIKEAQDDRYLLGLFSNADWDLLRDAPVPVWFVKSERMPDAGVVAAVELLSNKPGGDADVPALDRDVFRQARAIAESFHGGFTVAHAYSLPAGVSGFSGYAPLYAGDSAAAAGIVTEELSEQAQKSREVTAKRHGQAIEAFADYFAYPVEDIICRQGHADHVISQVAHDNNAGLVVMGAGHAGMLDRLFRKTTAEPTLAEADCDILFIKHPEASGLHGESVTQALQSHRSADPDPDALAKVLTDPSTHFRQPADVLGDERFSAYEKRRILRAWEHDMIQLMVGEGEGIGGGEPPHLDEVRKALRELRK